MSYSQALCLMYTMEFGSWSVLFLYYNEHDQDEAVNQGVIFG